jgi:hypothetical protein
MLGGHYPWLNLRFGARNSGPAWSEQWKKSMSGLDMFVEHPDASASDAVHVLLVGTVERGGEPNPDIVPGVRTDDLQTVALETLVRMKLNAFRRKDQVHILDMLSLGMIDTSWLDRYPEPLRQRLQQLLDDPDG